MIRGGKSHCKPPDKRGGFLINIMNKRGQRGPDLVALRARGGTRSDMPVWPCVAPLLQAEEYNAVDYYALLSLGGWGTDITLNGHFRGLWP